jgi:hypothetical protein
VSAVQTKKPGHIDAPQPCVGLSVTGSS